MKPREKGTIVSWFDDKGYGFIQPESGGDQVFVHISNFVTAGTRPDTGQKISFVTSTDNEGRKRAMIVRQSDVYIEPQDVKEPSDLKDFKKSGRRLRPLIASLIFSGIILTTLLLLAKAGKLPALVPAAYLSLSALSFIAYGLDKRKAINGSWRTPEATLHLIDLIGGWPGGLIAQHLFNHKRSKSEFKAVYWIIVIINCGALTWFFTGSKKADAWQFSEQIGALISQMLDLIATYLKSLLQ